jgi:isopenicillin N synthase-like dioxygenase
MRALNYPSLDGQTPEPSRIRASAHTDYGTVTILKSGGPGLQVSKDRDPPTWVDVPYLEDALIVNLGDLMRRWTNDRW